MKSPKFVAICLFVVATAGCTTTGQIAREREAFLRDPSSPAYGYDGRPLDCGRHRAFLLKHDPDFGDFLLSVVASASDTRIPGATLEYFTFRKVDRKKFELAVSRIPKKLLSELVETSCTDCLRPIPLSDYIEELRKEANQPPQRNAYDLPLSAFPSLPLRHG